MSESLKQRIQEDMKAAMRAQEKQRLGVIRLILAAIKQREVDERITLNDTEVTVVLDKMLKQRRESIAQYQQAGRQDLLDQELFEVEVIQNYLPTPLSELELKVMVEAAIEESGATLPKDIGKVMGLLKPLVQGRADMKALSEQVKRRLSQ